jgi:hypothetical protein
VPSPCNARWEGFSHGTRLGDSPRLATTRNGCIIEQNCGSQRRCRRLQAASTTGVSPMKLPLPRLLQQMRVGVCGLLWDCCWRGAPCVVSLESRCALARCKTDDPNARSKRLAALRRREPPPRPGVDHAPAEPGTCRRLGGIVDRHSVRIALVWGFGRSGGPRRNSRDRSRQHLRPRMRFAERRLPVRS